MVAQRYCFFASPLLRTSIFRIFSFVIFRLKMLCIVHMQSLNCYKTSWTNGCCEQKLPGQEIPIGGKKKQHSPTPTRTKTATTAADQQQHFSSKANKLNCKKFLANYSELHRNYLDAFVREKNLVGNVSQTFIACELVEKCFKWKADIDFSTWLEHFIEFRNNSQPFSINTHRHCAERRQVAMPTKVHGTSFVQWLAHSIWIEIKWCTLENSSHTSHL